MKSAGNVRIEDSVKVIPKKVQNMPTNSEKCLGDIDTWYGIPQQHYAIKVKMSGGRQTTELVLQPHKSRSSGT